MEAKDFSKLLRDMVIPGLQVRTPETEKYLNCGAGSGLEYGFILAAPHGGRTVWQVAHQSTGGALPLTSEGAPQIDMPPLTKGEMVSSEMEQAIMAWLSTSPAAEAIHYMEAYSATPRKGIQYGVSVSLADGGRVFIQQIWALAPNEQPRASSRCRSRKSV